MSSSNCDSEKTTPPSRIRHSHLTPPPTDEKKAREISDILRRIAEHRSSNTGQGILKVNERVWPAVKSSLDRDRIRFSYFPSTGHLVLRMHTKVHEVFLRSLNRRITDQLTLLSQESGSVADFARGIKDAGCATIEPRDPAYGTHDPDQSFLHVQSSSPTVIIEVAHSQKGPKLRTLAEDYILGSDLKIRVVVGVDIEYRKSKKATFSVWRAKLQGPDDDKAWVVEPTVADQIFRHDDGKRNIDQDAALFLPLRDFADQTTCREFADIDRDIIVSCAELYQYLEEAEAAVRVIESTKSKRNLGLKKRRRSPTPEEQLDDSDEAAYVEDEERISKRRDLEDASYNGSSSEEDMQ